MAGVVDGEAVMQCFARTDFLLVYKRLKVVNSLEIGLRLILLYIFAESKSTLCIALKRHSIKLAEIETESAPVSWAYGR